MLDPFKHSKLHCFSYLQASIPVGREMRLTKMVAAKMGCFADDSKKNWRWQQIPLERSAIKVQITPLLPVSPIQTVITLVRTIYDVDENLVLIDSLGVEPWKESPTMILRFWTYRRTRWETQAALKKSMASAIEDSTVMTPWATKPSSRYTWSFQPSNIVFFFLHRI